MMERRWAVRLLLALAMGAAAVLLSACEPQPVLKLVVTTTADGHDAAPGDGTCEMTVGGGDCSLRAALDEAATATHRVDIRVPAGTYGLSVPSTEYPGTFDLLHVSGPQPIGIHGDAPGVTVDANGSYGGIQVDAGAVGIAGVSVTGSTGGSGFYVPGGSLTLFGATSSGNGYGLNVGVDGTARLSYVKLTGNSAGGVVSGGSLELDHVQVTGNQGGVHLGAGRVVIADTTVSGNTAGAGFFGGISSVDPLTSTSVDLVVRRSVVDHNQSGGIAIMGGSLLVEDSTVDDGSVSVGRQGWFGPPHGPATGTIRRSTLSSAEVEAGGGTLTVAGSLLHGEASGATCAGAVSSLGYNLDAIGTCGFASTGDQSGVDPRLLPLRPNGGPTRSRLVGTNSPALDAIPIGTPDLCDGTAPLDQRGARRPDGAACDIGAVEGTSMTPMLPLSLVVDTAADGRDTDPGDGICVTAAGACSLRAAIDESNAWPATDAITVADGIDPVLSIAGTGEDANASGDLDITATVDLDGNDRVLDAAGLDRAIDVVAGVRTEIHDLEITGGSTTGAGGGVSSRVATGINPSVRLDRLTVHGNQAATGGGIDASGSVAVADSHVFDNTATVGGGGLSGGGTVTIDGTTIEGNTAGEGGGILVPLLSGNVRVTLSTVTGNTTTNGTGGGISVGVGGIQQSYGSLVLDRSSITGNTVTGGDFGQYGGGIFQNGGTVTVLLSEISGNSTGPLVYSQGGGIAAIGGSLTVRTSTISGNETGGSGGGIWNGSPIPSNVTVVASTVVDNRAGLGSAIAGNASVSGSVFVGVGTVPACYGLGAGTYSYSFAGDASCGFPLVGDALLGILGDNGGPTATHLPGLGSPLIDAIPVGTPELCDGTYPQDQRTLTRLSGAGCDIGAVERLPVP